MPQFKVNQPQQIVDYVLAEETFHATRERDDESFRHNKRLFYAIGRIASWCSLFENM
jgi:hypothetical protein